MLAQKNNKRNKDQCKNDNLLHVSHFVGLSGVGGVQRNFVEYINSKVVLESNGDFLHKVYTLGNVDPQYKLKVEVFDIRKLINLLSLILDIVSKDKIVHLYNNLASTKLAILLFLLPVSNLILHERGTVWNLSSSSKLLLSFVVWKANLVLANSKATKTILEKKFYIDNKKIKVLHNGIDTTIDCGNKSAHQSNFFQIGFIGRLDTPKGVHVLIDAMQYLKDKGINLKIAGTGVLECILKKQAYGLKNVSFIGLVENPYSFLSELDLLVVPSIREPLGNVCLEAGLCNTPVLAANIDGIPEIIENRVSGELVDPTDDIAINIPVGAVALPEFVVDPVTHEITPPRQINPKHLANKILELSLEEEILTGYAEQLHKRVVDYFNIDTYTLELHRIYKGM